MDILLGLRKGIAEIIKESTGSEVDAGNIQISPTKKEFEGDFTVLVFPYSRFFRTSPEECGNIIGDKLVRESEFVLDYNVIKGFLKFVSFHCLLE